MQCCKYVTCIDVNKTAATFFKKSSNNLVQEEDHICLIIFTYLCQFGVKVKDIKLLREQNKKSKVSCVVCSQLVMRRRRRRRQQVWAENCSRVGRVPVLKGFVDGSLFEMRRGQRSS